MRYFGQILFTLACLFFWNLTDAAAADDFSLIPGLVRVRSTYRDSESDGAKMTYVGYGIITEAKGRYYVITDSHLSQGGVVEGHPTLVIERYDALSKKFVSLNPVSNIANNLRDVSLIEISAASDSGIKPFAKYVSGNGSVYFEYGKLALSEEVDRLIVPENSDEFTKFSNGMLIPSTPLFVLPKGRMPLVVDGTETELTLYSPIFKGMSGLPFLAHDPREGWYVTGLVASTSRTFDKAWLARDVHVNEILHSIVFGIRAPLTYPNVHWYSRGGLLYRSGVVRNSRDEDLFSFQEVIFDRSKTGNGIRADGGGSSVVNAVASDRKALNQLGTGVLFKNADPYMNDQAKGVTAFRVYHQRAGHYLLSADLSTVAWLAEETSDPNKWAVSMHNVKPLGETSPISEYMWERWRDYVTTDVHSYMRPSEFNWLMSGVRNRFRCQKLRPTAESVSKFCTIRVSYEESTRVLSVWLWLEGDKLIFQLGAHGQQMGVSNEFRPEIEVQGTKGKYTVELSGFLMTSPATFRFKNDRPLVDPDFYPNDQVRFHVRSGDQEYVVH